MLALRFFTRADCELCHSAFAVLKRVQNKISFTVEVIDIDHEPSYASRYGNVIPVITCGDVEIARSFVEENALLRALTALQNTAN